MVSSIPIQYDFIWATDGIIKGTTALDQSVFRTMTIKECSKLAKPTELEPHNWIKFNARPTTLFQVKGHLLTFYNNIVNNTT